MPERETAAQPSESVENFLKAVYALQQDSERVSTNTLSDRLNISAPSVTDMAQRLVAAGLVDYQKYRGVVLTVEGERLALSVIRRHRLIELFLVRELGYEIGEVHKEAEQLEHAVSDQFIEALARKLDYPLVDPHGDPIPAADGTIEQRDLVPLTALPEHVRASVKRLMTSNTGMLEHALERGFKLDAKVEVIAHDPFDGPVTALVDGKEQIVGHSVANCILVELLNQD